MIEEHGRVIALVGDRARVKAERRSTCGQCHLGSACGTSLLGSIFGRHSLELLARNPIGARVGDEVVIGLNEQGLLRTAAAAYLVPVLGLIFGGALGESVAGASAEVVSVLGALTGLTLAFWWLRGYSEALAQRPEYQPVILRHRGPRVPVPLPEGP